MPSSESESIVVLELAEEFLERYRKGERPPLKEYIERHPHLESEIREVFPAMAMMEKIAIADASIVADATGPAPANAIQPLAQLGDYRIIREAGRGGMGVVYEAEQISLGRHVALKVLPGHGLLNPTFLERFRREAKAAARLHHTNIVPVFGTGDDNGTHYYAMQFIRGEGLDKVLNDLRQLRQPGKPLPPTGLAEALTLSVAQSLVSGSPNVPAMEESSGQAAASSLSSVNRTGSEYFRSVARIGVQVADALAYANKQGVLHRDIKPSNLLLDMQGTVWITDFGLAKADGDDLTHTGDIVGTIRYMAPERFDGKSLPQSDVYSLGLTLYEMVTLKPAFDAGNRGRLVEQVLREPPVPPRKIDATIPRDLETIILKCVAKDPLERYATADALAEDLRRFLADRTIQARRATMWEQTRRWARRNPAVASLLGVVVLLLTSVSIGSSVAAVRMKRLAQGEESARQTADDARDEAQRKEKTERWGRYRSDIAAASGALQLQNSGAARSALDDAPKEHRNWEWQYLHSQLDGASLKLTVPGGKVRSIALSPSGRQIAVCGANQNEVYLYDVATGKESAVLRGHSAAATSVAYRPDGKQVATASNDQTIRLWDSATGRQTALLKSEVRPANLDRSPVVTYNSDGSRIASSAAEHSLNHFGGAGTSRLWDTSTGKEIAVLGQWQDFGRPIAFSPDGKRVAVGSREYVHLCDGVTGRQLAVLGPHEKGVWQLAFSSDGKRIVSANGLGANAIHLWDGESGNEVAVLRDHTAFVTSVRFSPDGSRLVSAGDYLDSTARLWDAATGGPLPVLVGHKNRIEQVAFSPDGKRLVTASLDQTARLWDGHTGQLLAVLGGHTHQVWHILFNPKGTRVVTASDDATLRLWDAQTGELIGVLRGHSSGFFEQSPPVFTPDGAHLVSCSADGTIRIWDMSLVEQNGILFGHKSYVYDVAFSPTGEEVASSAWDGTARLWDATTGRQTGVLMHDTGIISSVAYNRDGRQLATRERERGVTLWDLASQKPAHDWRVPGGDWLTNPQASLNSAGTMLAASGAGGPVRLWEVATGREVARLEGHDRDSHGVAFDPDGRLLATAGYDGTVRLWDLATYAPVAVLRGHTGSVWRAAFSTDGKLLASGSVDKTIRLWDVQTHNQLAVIPLGGDVFSVAFSPDGTRLAAGCRDNTIRLIDVATRLQVAELRGHTDYVHAVGWSPDGTRLVSGSGDFTVRVWDSLSVQERAKRTGPAKPR